MDRISRLQWDKAGEAVGVKRLLAAFPGSVVVVGRYGRRLGVNPQPVEEVVENVGKRKVKGKRVIKKKKWEPGEAQEDMGL